MALQSGLRDCKDLAMDNESNEFTVSFKILDLYTRNQIKSWDHLCFWLLFAFKFMWQTEECLFKS